MASNLETRVRCLQLAIQLYMKANRKLEHVYEDFLAFVGDSEARLEGLMLATPSRQIPPMLRKAQELANLLEPPRAVAASPVAVTSKASATSSVRRSRGLLRKK